MRRYLRNREGRTFFFTVVTHERRPILTTDLGRLCLRNAFLAVQRTHPFEILAIVLLPDHLHAVWTLPHGESDYSTRWRLIKSAFTRQWFNQGGSEGFVNESRQDKQERGVWQRRYFEHTCRDEADLERCITYIHVNPVRHKLVNRVIDWPWSSFHRYVKRGAYPPDWGGADAWFGDEFAEPE